MAFDFDPKRVRIAVNAIGKRFPMHLEHKPPAGLRDLFQQLQQIDLTKLRQLKVRFPPESLSLLCREIRRAPSTKIMLATALLLAYRHDERAEDILRYFLHQCPPLEELSFIKSIWREELSFLGRENPWIRGYFTSPAGIRLVAYLAKVLLEKKIEWPDFAEGCPADTPLLRGLAERLFSRGAEMIAQLPPETAAALANHYLEANDETKVICYLQFYPDTYWKPQLLEGIYQYKGPPDPSLPFYRKLEKGRLWALRQRLFGLKIAQSGLPAEKQKFWMTWHHRIRDWQAEPGHIRVFLASFIILERPDHTAVFEVGKLKIPLASIPFDHAWKQTLETTLSRSWEIKGR